MSMILKLCCVGVAAGAGALATTHVLGGGLPLPNLSKLTSIIPLPNLAVDDVPLPNLSKLIGESHAATPGAGGPVDKTFAVRRVHIDGLVAQVEIVAIPQGPVRVQANGKPDTMKEFQLHVVGDEVVIRLDSDKDEAWFPWNLFNMWSKDRRAQDLRVRISAPLGTPYEIEGMIGAINAGDLDAPLRLEGHALTARFGRVQSARVGVAGSGRIAIGAIKETLDLEIAGSGNFEAASAAAAQVEIAGGGNVRIGPLAGGLNTEIAGAGDVRVAHVNGPVDIEIAGSGSVFVDGGRASSFSVDIAGSGDVVFKGEVVNPDVGIAGSGSVKVASYTGQLRQDIVGSGEFEVMNQGRQQQQPAQPAAPAPPAPPPAPGQP